MPKDVQQKESKPRAAKPASKGKPAAGKKDPNAPKKALSSYMIFSQEQRQKVKDENPDATFGELGKLLGAKWKSLSDAEKQPYLDLAEKDKTRAADALSVYEGKGANKSAAASKKKEQEDSASDDE